MTFIIPSGLIEIYNDGISSIIEFNGVNCTLVYPPKRVKCINCYITIGGKSKNKYFPAGPIPFIDGSICPLCQGDGNLESESTETVKMLVYFSPKDFVLGNFQLAISEGTIQTKSYIADLPKIEMANELRVHSAITGYKTYSYKRASEPVPHGFLSNAFILTLWNRVK